MRITEKTEIIINQRINKELYNNPLRLKATDNNIIAGCMAICNYEDLTAMINNLTKIRKIIEEETGVIF